MDNPQNNSIESGNQWLEKRVSQTPELAQAREYGVDLWTLVANLHRTPEERIRRHDIAIGTFQKLQKKGIIDENRDSHLFIFISFQLAGGTPRFP